MAKREQLPAEVHDHFARANVLHGYTQESYASTAKHALGTGQELLAAKAHLPHGRWEDECDRLFDGKSRTARGYMQFAKHMDALPKGQRAAILWLESSLNGAAAAAKAAAKPKPKPPEPSPEGPIDVESEPVDDCPVDDPEPPKPTGTPPKQYDRSAWMKQWTQAIKPVVQLVDKIAAGVGETGCGSQGVVQDHLNVATEEITEWMGEK